MAAFICHYLAECVIRALEPAGEVGFYGPRLSRSGSLAVSGRRASPWNVSKKAGECRGIWKASQRR